MLDMQQFHELLFKDTKNPEEYLKALKAVTKASPKELKALASPLGWQLWTAKQIDSPQA